MPQCFELAGPALASSRSRLMPPIEKIRAAYDVGLKVGRSVDGLPKACPSEQEGGALSERFAWLSGFSVGKAVLLRGLI